LKKPAHAAASVAASDSNATQAWSWFRDANGRDWPPPRRLKTLRAAEYGIRVDPDPPWAIRFWLDRSSPISEVRMERIRQDVGAEQEMVRLKERHTEIERRLSELERHISLTPDEQLERVQLKKEKLRSKDRIAILAQQMKAA
jgi:uncharacterized protein YdcH (DUF465 family)